MADNVPKFLFGHELTFTAAAIGTGGQVVELVAEGQVAPTTGVSTKVVGVLAQDVVPGQRVTVHDRSVQRCLAGEALAFGDLVKSGADGRVFKHTAGSAPIEGCLGIVLKGTATVGAEVEIRWKG